MKEDLVEKENWTEIEPGTCVSAARREKVAWVLKHRQRDLSLVLANIHDPHNVSAIYRSCDAFGVGKVLLYYTTTAFPVLGSKTSASARKWVESERYGNREDLWKALEGKQVLATSCSPKAKAIDEYDLAKPTAIIMGNEHAGVPEELIPHVDGELYIPMYGMIQSFNVSVAAALILSEASRQRKLAGKYNVCGWNEQEFEKKVLEWLKK